MVKVLQNICSNSSTSLVVSKLLLQLVASHRDGFYIMEYDNDDDFLLKHTVDQLNITFHPTDLVILGSIEEIPDFLIDMHRRQCKSSDLLLDWLLSITTFKNDENDK